MLIALWFFASGFSAAGTFAALIYGDWWLASINAAFCLACLWFGANDLQAVEAIK